MLIKREVFVSQKIIADKKGSFIDHSSGIGLPDGCKLTINWNKGNYVTIYWHDIIVKFFWRCRVSLVKFSCWSTFHVNIMTGSGVMTIFIHKGLARNSEICNTPIWVLPNICRLGWATNAYNKMLLNAAKFQGYSFYRFWVIQGKPIGRKITLSTHPD